MQQKQSVYAKAAASRRIVVHQSLMHSAPTGTGTGSDTIGERIVQHISSAREAQELLGGRAGGAETRCDHAAG